MSPKLLKRLLIAQTVLLVVVAWTGVWFARDEYREATHKADDDEGLAKPAAVSEEDGVPTVRLSVAAQRNVGLEVAMPEPAQQAMESSVPVVVVDAQPLAELQGRLRAARLDLEAAQAQARASAGEAQRVQALYDDERNASQRALEAARAQAGADAGRVSSAASALAALRQSAALQWGPALARELEADAAGGLIARLAGGRELLLRALLRGDAALPEQAELRLLLPGRSQALTARAISTAGAAAGGTGEALGGGRALLFQARLAPGERAPLPGQRFSAQLRDARQSLQAGVFVPASAVIWHAGQPWIYIRESNEPQPVQGAPEPSAEARAGAAAQAAAKTAKRDADDDDDKPRKPAAAAAEPATEASAPRAPESDAKHETHAFQRRAVPQARRVGDRWFLFGYAEDDPVVVRGAQVLLSEELKYQIRNENDD